MVVTANRVIADVFIVVVVLLNATMGTHSIVVVFVFAVAPIRLQFNDVNLIRYLFTHVSCLYFGLYVCVVYMFAAEWANKQHHHCVHIEVCAIVNKPTSYLCTLRMCAAKCSIAHFV